MGAGNSKKYAVPTSPALPASPALDATITPIQTQTQNCSYIKGCWLGNSHIPLVPDVIARCPFVQIRVSRKKSAPIADEIEDTFLQVWVEGDSTDTAAISVFKLANGEVTVVHTTETTNEIDNVVLKKFEYTPCRDETQQYFIIFIRNSDALEGQYTLAVKNYCKNYFTKALIPRQFKVEWWKPSELTIPTSIQGSWHTFSSYGGQPLNKRNTDWLEHNPSYSVVVHVTTRCCFTLSKVKYTKDELKCIDKRDHSDAFGIGLVVLSDGEEQWETRIVAHSIFPLRSSNELTEFRCVLVPGKYIIVPCTEAKRCVGKFLLNIKSDCSLDFKSNFDNLTTRSQQQSVWMTDPAPSPRHPIFKLNLRKDSFVKLTLAADEQQGDNKDHFEVEGSISVLEDDVKIHDSSMFVTRAKNAVLSTPRMIAFQTNTNIDESRLHLKAGKEYKIITRVTRCTTDRDVKFTIAAEALRTTDMRLMSDARNGLFKFRTNEEIMSTDPNKLELQSGPEVDVDEAPSLSIEEEEVRFPLRGVESLEASIDGNFTLDNTGGANTFPQFLVSISPGIHKPPEEAKVKLTFARKAGKKTGVSLQVFDVKSHLRRLKFDKKLALYNRFPLDGEEIIHLTSSRYTNQDVLDLNVSVTSKGTKFLLVVPTTLEEGYSGSFLMKAVCIDNPIVDNRVISIEHAKEYVEPISAAVDDMLSEIISDVGYEQYEMDRHSLQINVK